MRNLDGTSHPGGTPTVSATSCTTVDNLVETERWAWFTHPRSEPSAGRVGRCLRGFPLLRGLLNPGARDEGEEAAGGLDERCRQLRRPYAAC